MLLATRMPDAPSDLDRLRRSARRFAANVRPHHIALVAALAVVGITTAAVRTVALPGPRPVLDSERLQIQVVAPVEPEITPGSVMEVGDLVEGFEYRPLAPPVVESADWGPYHEDISVPEPRPTPRRYAGEVVVAAPPPPETPDKDWRDSRAGRWFGFDAPDRDYRAEREARRARIDARMERERERREVRWYRSDGEPADDDRRDDRRRRDEESDDLRG